MAIEDDFRAACASGNLEHAREIHATGEITPHHVDETCRLIRLIPRGGVMDWLLTLNPSERSLEMLVYRDVHKPDGSKYDWLDEWFATHRRLIEWGVKPREETLGALLVEALEADRTDFADWLLSRDIPLAHARTLAETAGCNFAFEALEKIPVRTDSEKQALLSAALKSGNLARAQRALELGAHPDRRYPHENAPDHSLPLAEAARCHSIDCLDLLLRSGADVNALDGIALTLAAEFGAHDAMKTLLAAGSRVDANEGAAMTAAAANGDITAMELLVAAGADANIGGQRALREAIESGEEEAADWLRKRASPATS